MKQLPPSAARLSLRLLSCVTLICFCASALANGQLNRYEVDKLSKHLANRTEDAAAYATRAGYWAAAGFYDLSLKDYSLAVYYDPDSADYLVSRAIVHFTLKDYAKADKDCRNAIELDGANLGAYRTRSHILLHLGRYKEAIAIASIGLAIGPSDPKLWRIRGHAYGEIDQTVKAANDLRLVVEIEPKNAEAWSDLGHFLQKNNDLDGALSALSKSYFLNNTLLAANLHLGQVHLAQGHVDLAEKAFDRVVTVSPSWQSRLNMSYAKIDASRGVYEVGQKNWLAAIQHFNKSLARHRDASVRLNLMDAYKAQLRHLLMHDGNATGAESLFKEATQNFPHDRPALNRYFSSIWTDWGLAEKGNLETARLRFNRAWKLSQTTETKKTLIEATVKLMEYYGHKSGGTTAARDAYNEALKLAIGNDTLTLMIQKKASAMNL